MDCTSLDRMDNSSNYLKCLYFSQKAKVTNSPLLSFLQGDNKCIFALK